MSNTKFKVGDKVRVRKDLEVDTMYGNITLTDEMEQYRGKEVEIVITDHRDSTYRVANCYYWFSEEMLEPVKPIFTKDDLKTGMIVTFRNGTRCLVMRDISYPLRVNADGCTNFFIGLDDSETWTYFDNYGDDLTNIFSKTFDIVKVERVEYPIDILHREKWERHEAIVVWERIEPKKMTLAEIEKELGYPVEVVKQEVNQ